MWSLSGDFKVHGESGFFLPRGYSIEFTALPGTLLDPNNTGCSSVTLGPGVYIPDAMGTNGVLLSSHLFRNGRKKYIVQSITGKTGVSKVDDYFFPVSNMFPGVTHTGTLHWRGEVCMDSNEFCSRLLKGKWVTETTFDDGMVVDPVDKVYFCDDEATARPVGYTETRQLNRPWSEGSVVRWRGHEEPVERQATGLLAFDEQGGRVSFPGAFKDVAKVYKDIEIFEAPLDMRMVRNENALEWWKDL
mmetsp:Transcript_9399/g.17324  ORF Transcript_9399/g.17324 Transcript_9399/m.17324 type:complete len:246 (-) Transcript_9399:100-837(-)